MYEAGTRIRRARPALLVKGEGAAFFYHDPIGVLAEELPDAKVITLPGGHAPHIISMESFLERFARFLSEQT